MVDCGVELYTTWGVMVVEGGGSGVLFEFVLNMNRLEDSGGKQRQMVDLDFL